MGIIQPFIPKLLRRRWFQAALLSLVVLATITLFYVHHKMQLLPEWWGPADAASAVTIRQGQATENLVVTEMNRISGRADGAVWTLQLSEAEINAWLATRLPGWAANQFPGSFLATGVAETHLHLGDGRIRFGTLVDFNPPAGGIINSSSARGVSIILEPSINAEGQLQLAVAGATVGRLNVPARTVMGRVLEHLKIPHPVLADLLKGQAVPAVVTQGKRRRMLLTSIKISPGVIRLIWRTEVGERRGVEAARTPGSGGG